MENNTSILAYQEIEPCINTRQRQIIKALGKLQYATNSMISHYLNIPINCVTGRTNELRKLGVIVYSHTSRDPYTKFQSKYWKLKKEGE